MEMVESIDRTVDLREVSDLATPWCLRVAVTLRIAEHIASGVRSAEDLAAATGCDRDSLISVLRQLVAKGVFSEPIRNEFELNAAARGLLDEGTKLRLDLDGLGGRMAGAWNGLLAAVRSGEPTYRNIFGRSFWEDLEAHPDIAAQFDALMDTGPADPDILVSAGWDSVRRVVDVGGGTGLQLAAVLREHPNVEGVLVDLPRTVARSPEIFAAAGVSDRVTVSAQSFFDPLPAGADVYLLKSVIEDWCDADVTAILRNCARAGSAGCRVVIMSGRSTRTPGEGNFISLILAGGRMRSLPQFRRLTEQAGLKVAASGPNRSGRWIVECTPV